MLHSVIPRAYTRHAEGPRLSLVLRRAQTVRYDVFIKTRMLTLSAPNTQTSAEMQEASLRAHVLNRPRKYSRILRSKPFV